MNLVTALALVIGALGAVATWLLVGGPLSGLSLWALFIAWGSFYSAGGGEAGLKNAIVGAIWGGICATLALWLNASGLLGGLGGLALPIIVGATVALMILGAHVPLLSAIPASVYGYASTAAFALLTSGAAPLSMSISNGPLVNVVASMALGAVFGYVSEKIAKGLAG
jgi:hypothetical protein